MSDPAMECVHCGAQFALGDPELADDATACPKCGSSDRPRLIGRLALANDLVNEYLAVKPLLTGRGPAMSPGHMTARHQAGLFIKNFGADGALSAAEKMPRKARKGYEKKWPGFFHLLRQVQGAKGQSK